jgi:ABC-2 type transport system permease protein
VTALLAHVAGTSFRRHATYRVATAAAVLENTVVSMLRGLVYVAVVKASGGVVDGLGTSEAITFAFVAGMIESSFWIVAPLEIGERIRSGDVITDLYRPVDFQAWWLASEAGRCAFALLAKGVPQVLIGLVVFDLATPSSLGSLLLFTVSVALSFLVVFSWKFTVSLAGFWLLDVRGVTSLAGAVTTVMSGGLLPLPLLPDGLAGVLRWLPPAAMITAPFELFAGGEPAAPRLAIQAAWAVVLLVLGRRVLHHAVAKVVVQGG